MSSGAIELSSDSHPLPLDIPLPVTRSIDPFADLVPLVTAGHRPATARLLRGLAPRMLGAARAVLGPRHPDLDDLLQESMVALLGALPAFEGRSSVAHYAARITVRVCVNGRKRARAERRFDEPSAEALCPDTTGKRPFRQLLRERRRALVRLLLDDLPEAQSEALALRYCLGLPMDEIAEMTGAPVNTIYSRLRLAKEALRSRVTRDPLLAEMLVEP